MESPSKLLRSKALGETGLLEVRIACHVRWPCTGGGWLRWFGSAPGPLDAVVAIQDHSLFEHLIAIQVFQMVNKGPFKYKPWSFHREPEAARGLHGGQGVQEG